MGGAEYAWGVSINKGRRMILLQPADGAGLKLEFHVGYPGLQPAGIDGRGLAKVGRSEIDAAYLLNVVAKLKARGGSVASGWRGSTRFAIRDGP